MCFEWAKTDKPDFKGVQNMIETVSEAGYLSLKDNKKDSRKLEEESFCFKAKFKKEQKENYSAVTIT